MPRNAHQSKINEIETTEYLEACENVRHYSGILSTIFTVFMTVFAGLVVFGFEKTSSNDDTQIYLCVSGLISTFMFWILVERGQSYWYYFRKRASELEGKLGYHLYSDLPKPRFAFLTQRFVARILFLSIVLFWGVATWLAIVR
jgi:hypothetical protein